MTRGGVVGVARRRRVAAVSMGAGIALTSVGVALLSVPVGLITLGVLTVGLSLLLGWEGS